MYIQIECASHSDTILFAGSELKHYLSKVNNFLSFSSDTMNRDNNRKRILLGLFPSDTCSPDEDEYEIEISHLNGYIKGSNPRSVLLGVYQYLTLLGCRFLRPGKEYEKIPSIPNIEELSISQRQKARYHHRGVCIEGADSPENILEFIDWLPKLGYNSFFLQFELPYAFLNLWYSHKNNPLSSPEDFSLEKAAEISAVIDEELRKRGLKHHRVGHGWTCSVLDQNTLGWVSSDAKLSEEQLSMTALVDGERGFYKGIPINTNLCYSNPQVVSSFVQKVVDYSLAHPEVDYLHIWLADAFNNHCECDACKNHLPSDLYVHILNEIDQALTMKKLSTKIVFLLYEELLWAPEKERLIHPERFVMMFAPISRTLLRSYDIPETLPEPPKYQRNQITLPVNLEENLSFLAQWQNIFKGDAFDYDYPLGRAHYGDMGYVHIARIIYEDIHSLKKLNLNGYISCQELRCFLPNGLPNYIMGKCLMGTDASFEELAAEYFQAAYGEQWEDCLSYLSSLSALCNCDYYNGKGNRINLQVTSNMKQLLQTVQNFHQKYLTPAPDFASPVEKLFWEHLDYHSEYCILLAQALLFLSEGNTSEAEAAWKTFTHYICSQECKFQKALDVYRVIEVSTNYAGFPLIEKF